MSRYFPVSLDLEGRSCVVLGGGSLAAEKAQGLLLAGARVTVFAAEPEAELRTAAAEARLTLVERDYRPGDLADAWLAIDASGNDELNAAVRREADERRVLLNVVDRGHLCDWIAPAIVRRGPLQVAVSTSGESPFLAARLRRRLERDLGEEWEPFVRLVGEVRRRLRVDGVPLAGQEAVYAALLRSDVRRLLRAGDETGAEALAEECIRRPRPGRVWLVGAGPGGPELLTLAAREVLATADVVFHDALIEPEVLALAGPGARLMDVGKRAGGPHLSQDRIDPLLLEAALEGVEVVCLYCGDPFVFGRGGEELAVLTEAGVEVRVVPGVSAATAAPTLAGIPLTLRGVASSAAFATARAPGGDPTDLGPLAAVVDTLVVLMPLEGLAATAVALAAVVGASRPAALVAAAGTSRQRVVRADLGTIAEACELAGVETPATLVVGEVVAASADP
ncbi:MAG TPA: uroporphyrinogen-III C-methyltransferase [Candidatus Dormibacteraeota bacterium]|nr:uroporphyrinogen-III C-methyltransferase [Candidatus Dormibacteraeota bacterium]